MFFLFSVFEKVKIVPIVGDEEEPVAAEQGGADSEGWASWAWSMIPQVLPEEDNSGSSGDESETTAKSSPPVFDISFYNRKATIVFKVCTAMSPLIKTNTASCYTLDKCVRCVEMKL